MADGEKNRMERYFEPCSRWMTKSSLFNQSERPSPSAVMADVDLAKALIEQVTAKNELKNAVGSNFAEAICLLVYEKW